MYRDIEEKLAEQRGEDYTDKERWYNGLPIGLQLTKGFVVSRP
jgi:hypothetical protein